MDFSLLTSIPGPGRHSHGAYVPLILCGTGKNSGGNIQCILMGIVNLAIDLTGKHIIGDSTGMKTNTTSPDYKGFRFPPEMISHAVWLYFRFSLSFRDVEELLAESGIIVTYETLR
jgi:hypothetical protein